MPSAPQRQLTSSRRPDSVVLIRLRRATAVALGTTTQGLVVSTPPVNELRWTPAVLAMTRATISLSVLAAALLLILGGGAIIITRRRRDEV